MKKSTFLTNIRTHLEKAVLPAAAVARPRGDEPAGFEPGDWIDRFEVELTAVSGVFHRAAGEKEALDLVLALFEEAETTVYLGWDDPYLPLPGLHAALQGRGYLRSETDLPRAQGERETAQRALAAAGVGVTGALAALADTGSLVVQCGAGRSRMASLLPHTHIALIRPEQMFPTLPHFVARHPDALQETSNLVFITGPSRTADIEQTLTLGVHGPKTVHVVLVANQLIS